MFLSLLPETVYTLPAASFWSPASRFCPATTRQKLSESCPATHIVRNPAVVWTTHQLSLGSFPSSCSLANLETGPFGTLARAWPRRMHRCSRALLARWPTYTRSDVRMTHQPHRLPTCLDHATLHLQPAWVPLSSRGRCFSVRAAPREPEGDLARFIKDATPLLVQGRQRMRTAARKMYVRISGVTFEGREELIRQLVPGQPVMAVKDPSNSYDPDAVQILTLQGKQLGFVPKAEAPQFPLEVVFGSVRGVGQPEGSTHWGAAVVLEHLLHEPTIDLLPQRGWSGAEKLQQAVTSEAWRGLEALTLQSRGLHPPPPQAAAQQQQQGEAAGSSQRPPSPDQQQHQQPGATSPPPAAAAEVTCAMTGVPASLHPMRACPVWRFDATAKRLQLLGMLPVAEALAAARTLDQLQGQQQSLEALRLLSQVYGDKPWDTQALQSYLGYVEQRRQRVQRENWRLDLSLLGL